MPTILRNCATCGEERTFEQPPCHDGHGADCPEWLCAECGHAILLAFDTRIDAVEVMARAA